MSSGARRHLRRVLGFSLLPACSFLASLVLLPLISARFGSPAWSTVALGQSTGAIASIIVGLTWPIEGGNLIARAAPEERGALYVRSVASQLIVLVVAGLVTVAVTVLLARDYPVEAALFAVSTAMNGLTAAWYYSGIGRPLPLLLNEGLVRLLGYAVALVGILLGAGLMWYAVTSVAASVLMSIANWMTLVVVPRVRVPRSILRDGWSTVRSEWFGTASRLAQSVYSFGGPSLFALLNPGALAAYAGARTVQVAAANGLSAVPNAFVSWVGGAPAGERRSRIGRAHLLMALFALTVFAGVALLGQIGMNYLFAGRLTLPLLDLVLLALGIALAFYNRTYQVLVLIPLGRKSLVYRSTMISSLIGLALQIVLIPLTGLTGGLAVPVAVVVGLQVAYRFVLTRPAVDKSAVDKPAVDKSAAGKSAVGNAAAPARVTPTVPEG
jgi:O-antigen/teichoic acid export membrane protein